MSSKQKKLIVILGPTASGKTKLAVKLAAKFNGEIVSADSRQVYKEMDIGTGKDLKDYEIETNGKKIKIPYHLIDVASPKKQFSLAKYQKMAYFAIDDIIQRGKTPFLVGGTGLYLDAVVDGVTLSEARPDSKLRSSLEKLDNKKLYERLKELDPKLVENVDQGNKRRMIRYIEIMKYEKKSITALWREQKKARKYGSLILGIYPVGKRKDPREILNKKIDKRVDERLKEGMVEEVKNLRRSGLSWKRMESFGLEYKFIALYLQGKMEYDEMVSLLKIAIHQYAKRQMTWFKRKKGIVWIKDYKQAKNLLTKRVYNNMSLRK